MLKKTVAVTLIAVITCLKVAAPAENDPAVETQTDEAIKAKVQKIGVGEKRKIRVKLRDGTELRGYVSKIETHSFTVTDSATRQATSVSYKNVEKIRGQGLSTTAKVLIVAGIGVGIVVVIVAIHGIHPLGGGFRA